jgi:hypothetical protein
MCRNAQDAVIRHDKVKYGLMSNEFPEKRYCSDEAIEKDQVIIDGIENCSSKINKEYVEAEIAKCGGKRSCSMDFTDPSKFITEFDSSG